MAFALGGAQCYDLTATEWIEVSSSGRIYILHDVEKSLTVEIVHDQRLPFIHRVTLGSTLPSFMFTLISHLFSLFQLSQSVSTCVVSVADESEILITTVSHQKTYAYPQPQREKGAEEI